MYAFPKILWSASWYSGPKFDDGRATNGTSTFVIISTVAFMILWSMPFISSLLLRSFIKEYHDDKVIIIS